LYKLLPALDWPLQVAAGVGRPRKRIEFRAGKAAWWRETKSERQSNMMAALVAA